MESLVAVVNDQYHSSCGFKAAIRWSVRKRFHDWCIFSEIVNFGKGRTHTSWLKQVTWPSQEISQLLVTGWYWPLPWAHLLVLDTPQRVNGMVDVDPNNDPKNAGWNYVWEIKVFLEKRRKCHFKNRTLDYIIESMMYIYIYCRLYTNTPHSLMLFFGTKREEFIYTFK